MAHLQFAMLGTFRATLDGAALTAFGYDKVRALLAYLAVECDRPHHRESLAGLLWPEQPKQTARLNLSQALSRLRRILDDKHADPHFIDVTRQTLQFNPNSDHWLDAVAFTQALDACQKHGHERLEGCDRCLERLEGAAALYRGGFLEGFSIPDSPAFEEWALLHRERLHRLTQETLARLARCYAASEEYEKALPHAWRQVELDPWREAAQRGLMRLLALSGQRGAALAQYEVCRRLLAEELDVEPAQETTALHEMIRSGQVGPTQLSPIEALLEPLPSHNLPAQPNPFIGRAQELADLLTLIRGPAVRLVTVVGPGGMGKTRLALQATADALEGFPEGVWLVELARVTSSDAVPMAVANALGAQPQSNRDMADTIVDSLQTRELLLLLDNCEHVLDGVVPLAAQLLSRCPQLTVVVTSREALRVPGEQLFEVPPMKLPELDGERHQLTEADAVRLFLARAQSLRPGFALTHENAKSIVDICRRLDGMPLALELAAARTRVLSPEEIVSRLDDRFRLLTAGGRTAPERQQTLHNTVAWSYELLDSPERALFDRLAVFRGGFTLTAAEGVCSGDGVESDDVLDLLTSLVDKSLVVVEQTDDGTMRYRLLETLRQFGAQQLDARGKTETLQLRHARHFLAWVEEMESLLDAWEDWPTQYRQLDPESDNLAAAMRWSLEHNQAELALRMGAALKWWLLTRPQFGQYAVWLKKALTDWQDASPRFRAKALHAINLYGFLWSRYDEASAELAEEELAAAEQAQDPDLVAQALVNMGRIASFMGQRERAGALYQQSLAIGREIESQARIIHASVHLAVTREPSETLEMLQTLLPQTPRSWRFGVLSRLAAFSRHYGSLSEAERYSQEAFECAGELGSPAFQADGLNRLGIIAILQGNYERAEQLLGRSRQLARRCGEMLGLFEAVRLTGETAWHQGDVATAERRWSEALDLARQHGGPGDIAEVQRWQSYAACAAGDFDHAERLCQESLQVLLEGDVFGRGGATLALARVALFRGNPTRAVKLFQQSLRYLQRLGDRIDTVRTLEGLTWALASLGRGEEATVLLGFLAAHREQRGMVLPPVDQPHHERALSSARKALSQETFAAAWAAGAALTLEEAVQVGLG
jgi:predicted ATPase/DNA-binding SARP family transcriptional activator